MSHVGLPLGPADKVRHRASKRLIPGEVLQFAVRRHWFATVGAARVPVAVAVVSVMLPVLLPILAARLDLFAAALLVALAWYGVVWLDWFFEIFMITDRRVMLVRGLITVSVGIMPVAKVTDMTFRRTPWGRLLGYGTFVFESAGQKQGLELVNYVREPDLRYQQMCAVVFGSPYRPTAPAAGAPGSGAQLDTQND